MKESIGAEFMRGTRYARMGPADQVRGLPQPPLELPADEQGQRGELPAPETLAVGDVSLRQAIEARASVREYSQSPLTAQELSWLLWCTQGVKRTMRGIVTLRTVPSAGARHALETFLLLNRVEGIPAGLYRFLAREHRLLSLSGEPGLAERLAEACFGQGFVASGAATFVWVADAYRMTWRYGERGYRYLHLDAGHVCQNLYLAAEAVGCGACAVGAFDDDAVNGLLGLDGEKLFAIYLAAVGRK